MEVRTTKALRPARVFVFAAALACSGGESASTGATAATTTSSEEKTTGTTGASASSTSASASTTSTGTTTGAASSTTGDPTDSETGCSFLGCTSGGPGCYAPPGLDGVVRCLPCSPWAQDCPDDQKCAPSSNDGGSSWNATKCTSVDPNPKQPGDACVAVDGGVSGVDDCDQGVMCWDVDPETNEGVCVALCEGSPDNPKCPLPATTCAIDGDLALCFPSCNPLLQDCADGELCTFAQADGQVCTPGDLCVWDGEFVCAADASGRGGGFGELCEDGSGCDPGSACLFANYVDGCGGDRCCSPFCDTTAPNTCPGELQECSPLFAEDMLPAGYENVGICAIPQ